MNTTTRTIATRLACLVGSVLFALAVTPGGALARPVSRVIFGIQAATAGRPDARPYLTYSATPGAAFRDQVAIENLSRTPLRLSVYATDATAAADGSIGFPPASRRPVAAGQWIKVDHTGPVTVPARGATGRPSLVIVPLRIAVPADATPGDHVAAVIVSLRTTGHGPGTSTLLDQRVAERVYLRISGTVRPQLSIESLRVVYHQQINPLHAASATVSYTVRNTGNALVSATQTVDVYGTFGAHHRPAMAAIVPLLPGRAVHESVTVKHIWPVLRVTAKVTVTPAVPVRGELDPRLRIATATASTWAIPWTLLVTILLVAVAVVLAIVQRRRRQAPVAARVRATSGVAR